MSNPAQREVSGERIGALEWLSRAMARAAGSSASFAVAAATIVVWAAFGPFFAFSDTWQLVVNTSTTIVTFLMVFLIQRSQNRDSQALHLKLNELVAALEGASNRLIDAEHLTEADLEVLQRHYAQLVHLAQRDPSLTASHSDEEADRAVGPERTKAEVSRESLISRRSRRPSAVLETSTTPPHGRDATSASAERAEDPKGAIG